MRRILHILPSRDYTGAMPQAALVSQALAGSFEFHSLRLGYDLPWRKGLDLHGWRTLDERVAAFEPEVIHAWLPADDWWTLQRLTRRTDARVVVSWRELEPWPVAWLPRWGARRADRIVVPTEGLADAFARRGIESQRISIVPDAVPARVACSPPPLLPSGAHVIVAAGRWRWSDRWKDLIWSFALLRFLRDDLRLVLCGHGEHAGRLQAYCERIAMADRVHLRPVDEFPAWLARGELFGTLRDDPGVSPWLLMALERGMPVVASRTCDHMRLLSGECDSLLAPMGDRAAVARCANRVLENPQWGAQLGSQGRVALQRRHNLADVAARWASLYSTG